MDIARWQRRRNEFESWGRHRSRAKVGAPIRRKATGKFLLLVVPLHFLSLKAQLVVLVSAFVMVSTVWSVYCLLFFYSRCPHAQPFVKMGGTCPPCPMESAPLPDELMFHALDPPLFEKGNESHETRTACDEKLALQTAASVTFCIDEAAVCST